MEIIFNYTDISFTDKQKEDIPGLYDKLVSSGAWEKIKQAIPDSEIKTIHRGVTQTIDAFYRYRNSVMGVLDNVKTDYSDLNLNLDELTEKITDPETLKFVKDFLTKVN
jgi:uridine phosphorylase